MSMIMRLKLFTQASDQNRNSLKRDQKQNQPNWPIELLHTGVLFLTRDSFYLSSDRPPSDRYRACIYQIKQEI
jgi:hypothetical protein